jgi:hypothetical protein
MCIFFFNGTTRDGYKLKMIFSVVGIRSRVGGGGLGHFFFNDLVLCKVHINEKY